MIVSDVWLERFAELLGCDPDPGSIEAEMQRRNRERDRMRKAIADLRGRIIAQQERGDALGRA